MIYHLSDFPPGAPQHRRPPARERPNGTRAWCGAGYNWPTDIKFASDPSEITCAGCLVILGAVDDGDVA